MALPSWSLNQGSREHVEKRERVLASMIGDSECLNMIVRSGLCHLPILELLTPNDVLPGDKEYFGVDIRIREMKYTTCGIRDSYYSSYI